MKKLIGIFLVLFLSQNLFAQSGWQWINPLPSGNDYIQVKFLNSKTGFAVGWARAVSKTTNGGINWVIKNSGIYPANMSYVCFIDSNNIIVGGSQMYKSTNGGENWNIISSEGEILDAVFVNNNTGFVLNNNINIKKTTNGGYIWENQSFTQANWKDIKFVNNQTGFVSGIVSGKAEILKTTNQGINWNSVYSGDSNCSASNMKFINELTGFALVAQSKTVLKTTNSGTNWFALSQFSFSLGYYFCMTASSDSLLYIETNGRNYRSTNGTISWDTSFVPGLSICFPVKDTGYTVGSGGTIYSTTSHGNSWFCQSSPWGNTGALNKIYFSNENTGYAVGKNQLFKTTNTGLNWHFFSFPNYDFNTAFFLNGETGYSVGVSNSLIKTSDGGNNWDVLNSSLPGTIYSINFINTNTGFVSLYGGYIYRTSDGGLSWSYSTIGTDQFYSKVHSINFLDSTNGFLVSTAKALPFSNYSEVYKTTNCGLSWLRVIRNSDVTITAMKFTSVDTGYVSNSGPFNQTSIDKTVNGGLNWVKIFNEGGGDLNTVRPNTVYIPGYKSTNGGLNWVSQDILFEAEYLASSIVFINQTTGFIVGGYGANIIKTTDGGGVISGININSSLIPDNFSLHQNYPNPFNPSTKINYEIKASGFVSIKVFDLLGKEVATLVNEKQSAGSYAVDFNSSEFNLPSGIYFYTLNAGEFKETRKMVLVK